MLGGEETARCHPPPPHTHTLCFILHPCRPKLTFASGVAGTGKCKAAGVAECRVGKRAKMGGGGIGRWRELSRADCHSEGKAQDPLPMTVQFWTNNHNGTAETTN